MNRLGNHFFASTRGQIVNSLRRNESTVNELAEALGLTKNAIRVHLTTLERDGLVKQAGKRRGVRKPESLYALTSEAEQLFPKAYHLLLNHILSVLSEHENLNDLEILHSVGKRLAVLPASEVAGEDVQARAEKAVEVLTNLGGLAELEHINTDLAIQGYSCPLATIVQEHPHVCQLAESLLEDIIGQPVKEECDKEGTPRCRFLIPHQ